MFKFEEGQEVLFSRGDHKDLKGVVVDPHFQISQSDWPEVLVQYGDRTFLVDTDKVRPAVDPYEYGATWKDLTGIEDAYWEVYENEWGTLEDAQEDARQATEMGNKGVKIMRRLKAGEAEDYNA